MSRPKGSKNKNRRIDPMNLQATIQLAENELEEDKKQLELLVASVAETNNKIAELKKKIRASSKDIEAMKAKYEEYEQKKAEEKERETVNALMQKYISSGKSMDELAELLTSAIEEKK